jgi:hypothetical protein
LVCAAIEVIVLTTVPISCDERLELLDRRLRGLGGADRLRRDRRPPCCADWAICRIVVPISSAAEATISTLADTSPAVSDTRLACSAAPRAAAAEASLLPTSVVAVPSRVRALPASRLTAAAVAASMWLVASAMRRNSSAPVTSARAVRSPRAPDSRTVRARASERPMDLMMAVPTAPPSTRRTVRSTSSSVRIREAMSFRVGRGDRHALVPELRGDVEFLLVRLAQVAVRSYRERDRTVTVHVVHRECLVEGGVEVGELVLDPVDRRALGVPAGGAARLGQPGDLDGPPLASLVDELPVAGEQEAALVVGRGLRG